MSIPVLLAAFHKQENASTGQAWVVRTSSSLRPVIFVEPTMDSRKRCWSLSERPWAKVGIDLFGYRSHTYLICVDYYSSFWEIDLLEDTQSATVIQKSKAQFARHGIPENVCVRQWLTVYFRWIKGVQSSLGFRLRDRLPSIPSQ